MGSNGVLSQGSLSLIRAQFERILELVAQLGLYRSSPKFFIIYAHDNDNLPDHPAHARVVKDFISWFKKLELDVDSDRSPHGRFPGRGQQIPGASNDILINQLCLLPKEWDEKNVDLVLIFGSKLLGRYVEDEGKYESGGETFTQAVEKTCEILRPGFEGPNPMQGGLLEKAFADLKSVRDKYSKGMGNDSFHQVLTELAVFNYRAKRRPSPGLIPIFLCEPIQSGLEQFVTENDSVLRVEIDTESQLDQYKNLFKILLRFEEFEDDRPIVEALQDCFDKCVEELGNDGGQDAVKYHQKCEVLTLQTLRKLTDSPRYKQMKKQIANDTIRRALNLHSLLSFQSIQTISGKPLPQDSKNVDIALADTQRGTTGEPTELVTIYELFKERVLQSAQGTNAGQETKPNRIFIRGLPGMGKTTLSRRIMYEYNCHEALRNHYDFTIRLPLRKLEHTSDLEEILVDEFFRLEPEGKKLGKRLTHLILKHGQTTNPLKILFVLDGLDETRGWSTEKHQLLSLLIEQPNVIILSRFGPGGITTVDVEMEVIGLSDEGIMEYINNSTIVNAEDSPAIMQFVKTNPGVNEMVRIPIHLGILCYSWEELKQQQCFAQSTNQNGGREQRPTTTEFYQAVMSKLWRKDIPRLGKHEHGQLLTEEIINDVQDPERLAQPVQAEINLLGKIAVNLANEGKVEFVGRDIQIAIREHEARTKMPLPLALESNIQKLSVLSVEPTFSVKTYTFLHLTVQEFFMATYLVRNPGLIKEHVSKHKYSQRYQNVWRFVAGLLPTKDDLEAFFDRLQQEPRDLVGKPLAYILMYCLSECESRLDTTSQDGIHKMVSDWLSFEVNSNLDCTMINSTALPDNIFVKALQDADRWLWDEKSYPRFDRTDLSGFLCDRLISHLGDHWELGSAQVARVSGILSRQSSLPLNKIARLRQMFESNDVPQKHFAETILGSHGNLTESDEIDAINRLAAGDKGERTDVWPSNCRDLSPKATRRLVECLRGNWDFRARILLIKQFELPQLAIDALVDGWTSREDFPKRERASHLMVLCKAKRPNMTREQIERLQIYFDNIQDHSIISETVCSFLERPEFHQIVFPKVEEILDSVSPPSLFELRDKIRVLDSLRNRSRACKFPHSICQVVARGLGQYDDSSVQRYATEILWRQKIHFANEGWRQPEIVQSIQKALEKYPLELAKFFPELLGDNPLERIVNKMSDSRGTDLEAYTMWRGSHIICELLSRNDEVEANRSHSWLESVEDMLRTAQGGKELARVFRLEYKLKPDALLNLIPKLQVWLHEVGDIENVVTGCAGRPEATKALLELMERMRKSVVVTNAVVAALEVGVTFSPQVHDRLAWLIQDPHGYGLQDQAARVLISQPLLSLGYLPDILTHMDLCKGDDWVLEAGHWWNNLNCEDSANYIESLDEKKMACYLKTSFLRWPSDRGEAPVIWIDGGSLYWYDSEGSQRSRQLRDEQAFRRQLYQAQERMGIPKWARIGSPV